MYGSSQPKYSTLGTTGLWKGLRAAREGPIVSHLFFVDDLILFDEETSRQAKCIKEVVKKCCVLSGQKLVLQNQGYSCLETLADRQL